ncbi:MAG: non-canonical purine NTP pyrophosphatase [Candidatus Thalassarchaeum sp.]
MRLLFATSNKNKVAEAGSLLADSGHTVEQLLIGGLAPQFDEPKELGIEAVAKFKMAQALLLLAQEGIEDVLVMVEDSGVFLDAFNDWPGAESADVESEIGLDGVLSLFTEGMTRGAEYRAVAIVSDGSSIWSAEGICRGEIAESVKGDGGFGYDPIFIPDEGDGRTFGEWEEGKYSVITHRAKAMNSLAELLRAPSR